MERFGSGNKLWKGVVNGVEQIINIVGTYGENNDPIVRVDRGNDFGKTFAINWETGVVIKELDLV